MFARSMIALVLVLAVVLSRTPAAAEPPANSNADRRNDSGSASSARPAARSAADTQGSTQVDDDQLKRLMDEAELAFGKGDYNESIRLLNVCLTTAKTLRSSVNEGICHLNLGNVYAALGRDQDAIDKYLVALGLFQVLSSLPEQGEALRNLGLLYFQLRHYSDAIPYLERAIAIARQRNGHPSFGDMLQQLGESRIQTGQLEGGLAALRESLDVYNRSASKPEPSRIPYVLLRCADAEADLGRKDEAARDYRAAANGFKAALMPADEGAALYSLGKMLDDTQRPDEAGQVYADYIDRRLYGTDKAAHLGALYRVSSYYWEKGKTTVALARLDEALALADELGDAAKKAEVLMTMGRLYALLKDQARALDYFVKARLAQPAMHAGMDDLKETAQLQSALAEASLKNGQLDQALTAARDALAGFQKIDDLSGQALSLMTLGEISRKTERYPQALEHYRRALDLLRQAQDGRNELEVLVRIGQIYREQGRPQDAIAAQEAALALSRERGEAKAEGRALSELGLALLAVGRHQQALVQFKLALEIDQRLGDRAGEATDLGMIANVYRDVRLFGEALDYYDKILAIHREPELRRDEGADYTNRAIAFLELGRYAEALASFQQALVIDRELKDLRGERLDLDYLGMVYRTLGRPAEALSHHRQALQVARRLRDPGEELPAIVNIGVALQDLGRTQEAQDKFREASKRAESSGSRGHQAALHLNIGTALFNEGRYREARGHYERALELDRSLGNRLNESADLGPIGSTYLNEGQFAEATDHFRRALAIQAELGDAVGASGTWRGLAELWTKQSQPGAAILAGKLATNAMQGLREGNRTLDDQVQRAFASTRDPSYRTLAALLIQQQRFPEAQEVLDMRKEAELYDYLARGEGFDPRRTRAGYNTLEAAWVAGYDKIAADLKTLGEELRTLELVIPQARTDAEQARIAALVQQREALVRALDASLDDLVKRFGSVTPTDQAKLDAAMAGRPGDKRALLKTLATSSGSPTALVQYLVTDQGVSILLTTPDGWIAKTVAVERATLYRELADLSTALTDKRLRDAKPPAQRVYDRLVAPIEAELKAQGIRTLLAGLDDRLRYLPLAALYDGQQWLAERFALVVYTPASEHREATPPARWRVAGLGTSKAHRVNGRQFSDLPAVRRELDGIVRREDQAGDAGLLPGIERLDKVFTVAALGEAATGGYAVVHIASHFDLRPGQDRDSFLLLGTGEALSLRDLRDQALDLRQVDLFTLSACETALGGADSDGTEIEGLGGIVQRQGAQGVIASLWPVADASTAWLMRRFYELRTSDGLDKAAALSGAQVALMGSDRGQVARELDRRNAAGGSDAAGKRSGYRKSDGGAAAAGDGRRGDYRHPYFWAPFILMGNWL